MHVNTNSAFNINYEIEIKWTKLHSTSKQLEMWANAQRGGRPAEYRWRPLFNAAKFG